MNVLHPSSAFSWRTPAARYAEALTYLQQQNFEAAKTVIEDLPEEHVIKVKQESKTSSLAPPMNGRGPLLSSLFQLRNLVLAISFIAVHGHCAAQDYHPFPMNDAVWSVGSGSSDCSMFGLGDGFCRMATTGDTLIAGVVYAKLDVVFSNGACGIYQRSGAVRNDTTARRVYFMPSGSSEEEVLYDFGLQPGSFAYLFGQGPLLLDSINVIDLGNEQRRRFNFTDASGFQTYHVIEGVGATIGVTSGQDTVDDDTYLICMDQGDERIYEFEPMACSIYTGSPEETEMGSHFSIFPNPVVDRLVVQTEDPLDRGQFQLRNSLGQVLEVHFFDDVTHTLDVSRLAPGLYSMERHVPGSERTHLSFIKQ
ncbi:MAG: T9SS type A sorting domain-containing protein [Flavobacteriales bacterium]|nr:T9SS type A sorting domain-containing protein [Flavobacteriales bacterium]